jgi:murein DD-endopeptidase / murein LD-carboxypeptidase
MRCTLLCASGRVFLTTMGCVARVCERVEVSDLREGDLLFFKINGKTISHVGVYLEDGSFLHASTKRGVMISHMNEDYYKRTFSHAGRL